MIQSVTDTWRVDHEVKLPFQSVWLDTVTKINDSNYEVFLQELMLYPQNKFTRRNPDPVVYYQDALQLIPIETIKTFYTNYWSSTTEQYWPT